MSELRQDLVSGDWILIAPGRGKRPHQFREAKKRKRAPKRGCPFENPKDASRDGVLLSLPEGNDWRLQVIQNKYPAVTKEGLWVIDKSRKGPFLVLPGYGYHEVVITKDHDDALADLSPGDAILVFRAFQERYHNLSEDNNISYIHMFANWGEKAGASIYHPHYQILGIPVIPPDISRSLAGSAEYHKKHSACVHCTQIEWEIQQKERVICETKEAVVFCPFVSKEPFEMRVFPKKHQPFFEDSGETELASVSEALQTALGKLKRGLGDPDYNFFIHTSPSRNREAHSHYHWHIEIFPRTNISAGFELGTSIEINPMDPNDAAEFLRNA